MSSACGGGRTLGQFALVSYLPDPLGSFLDRLRLDLDPECKPHAHVTLLPPRPVTCDLAEAVGQLVGDCHSFPPIRIELGEIQVFPVSNVLYVELARGERQVRELHALLDSGALWHECAFDFHPHVTIAQEVEPSQVETALRSARAQWASWDGPRSFTVDSLSFVQNVAPKLWVDVARIPLAVPVPSGR